MTEAITTLTRTGWQKLTSEVIESFRNRAAEVAKAFGYSSGYAIPARGQRRRGGRSVQSPTRA